MFTCPQGGSGVYNLQLHLLADYNEAATFHIRKNGAELCRAVGDESHSSGPDAATASCSATVVLQSGEY